MRNKCAIWRTPAYSIDTIYTDNAMVEVYDSPRAGGKYQMDFSLDYFILDKCEKHCKARLTTWLVNQRKQGNPCPEITRDDIKAAREGQDMRVPQRVDRVLQFLEIHTQTPTDAITISPDPGKARIEAKTTVFYQLLAHSESIGWDDLKYLLDHLEGRQLVRIAPPNTKHEYRYVLTVPGFQRLDELRKVTPVSTQAFVAMWFDGELKPAYRDGFKRAIKDAGYDPIRIDERHFSDKIDDRIISEIRKSRFVVADFSHGDDGARGSVYFEAGFAKGLGLEVIFTCRDPNPGDLHFDTRQYPHIMWKDAADLRTKLAERITAIMGEGPHKRKKSER